MATNSDTIDFILHTLGNDPRFTTRKMFGEYALYADGRVVGLVCNDQLYVKIRPETTVLADVCTEEEPYPGAKPYYLIEESQLSTLPHLAQILFALALVIPPPKLRKKPKK